MCHLIRLHMVYVVKKEIKGQTYYYEYESYREKGKVKHRYVRYLGKSTYLRKPFSSPDDLTVLRSLEYGAVAALYTIAERIGLSEVIYRETMKGGGEHLGKLLEIMVINRCLEPMSRNRLPLWYEKTVLPFLVNIPLGKVHPQILYNAMDYLTDAAILRIQKVLFRNIGRVYGIDTSTVFYDLTSSYFEGTECSLGEFGHSTDHRPDKLQITIGLGVDRDCIPITHMVFSGAVRDVTTVQDFRSRLRSEFGLDAVVVVIDRGMISKDNLDCLQEGGSHYVVARKMGARERKVVQGIPDDRFVRVVLTTCSDEYTVFLTEQMVDDRRWVICWNKEKEADDRLFRETMIEKSVQALERIKKGCGRRNLKTKEQVYHAVQKEIEHYKTKKFFSIEINERGSPRLQFSMKTTEIEQAQRLDGKYILETSSSDLTCSDVVQVYHERDVIEKFFQMLKDIIGLRPTYVYKEQHVKAHVFICVLAVLLLSLLRKTLRESGRNMTSVKALEILDGIKRVEFSIRGGKEVLVRTTKITDKQQEIISILNIGPPGL